MLWGGSDECEHEWGEELAGGEGHTGKTRWQHIAGDADGKVRDASPESWEQVKQGQFCRLCGCWRGSLGLEPAPELYIEHLVGIFQQVRRVLRDDGTLWLNIAGCYASGKGTCFNPGGGAVSLEDNRKQQGAYPLDRGNVSTLRASGLKPKDWVPIPWMLGMALQRDGWWLRSPIIWAKGLSFCETYSGSVMPESVRDRPTTSYEHLLLLTKSSRYFYDAEAVREKVGEWTRRASSFRFGGTYTGNRAFDAKEPVPIADTKDGPPSLAGRNLRSVWAINPHPFKEAHFATFPPKLVEPCIKAGTSERGCCPECGKGWGRMVEKGELIRTGHTAKNPPKYHGNGGGDKGQRIFASVPPGMAYENRTLGWRPGCSCNAGDPIPCLVLDPFVGSGTTVMVALRLERRGIGIDLSEEYCRMARRRIIDDNPMFNIPGEAQ